MQLANLEKSLEHDFAFKEEIDLKEKESSLFQENSLPYKTYRRELKVLREESSRERESHGRALTASYKVFQDHPSRVGENRVPIL